MRRIVPAILFGMAFFAAFFAAVPGPGTAGTALAQSSASMAAASSVIDMRMGDHGDKTRFVLEMTAPLGFRIFSAESPRRMVVDFPPLDWRAANPSGPGVGLVSRHRFEGGAAGPGRIVLELSGPARVRDAFFLPPNGDTPYRFVLDLEPVAAEAFAGQVYTPAGAADGPAIVASPALPGPAPFPPAPVPSIGEVQVVSTSAVLAAPPPPVEVLTPLPPVAPAVVPASAAVNVPVFPLPGRRPERAPIRVIAIDAGHGGLDPGAIGVSGIFEKTITMSVARMLQDELERTGRYRVVMTRDSDVYLKLRHRVSIAREQGADLFISLHADSIGDPSVRGASVYTLSDVASDEEAEMLAARENRADALAGVQLDPEDDVMASILIDLAQRVTQNESHVFAEILVAELADRTLLLNNSHRRAGFAVLTAPDVPSVLIEMGYLSNPSDEGQLRSEDHRRDLARGIAAAIDQYFEVPIATARS
ncbi:N-acetylmuramoyl-L-alanine amidase [Inquilinus sp. CAU 1745]|uniref:N-acetylmuramoyl-L-alanine amidase n=1 Tax=Inquilinus sp. CAU 1745 TaxID=3140369 RepID=UPI00325B81F8